MNDELQKLIAEQAEELRRGNRQSSEAHVVVSLDFVTGEEATVGDFVDQDGDLYQLPTRKRRTARGCTIHGLASIKVMPSGAWFCRPCSKERMTLRRRMNGVKPRNFCPHEGKYTQIPPSGKAYCGECARIRNRKARKRG